MEILVIGGTRFFGAILVSRLLDAGHEVTILSRGRQRPSFWGRVRHLEADRRQSKDLERLRAELAFTYFDIVVDNIAADGQDVAAMLEILGNRIGHYILTTTGRVYGDLDHLGLLSEEEADLHAVPSGYIPGSDPSLDYAVGKRQAESVLWEGCPLCPFTIIRPAPVEGPGDPTGRNWFWLQRVSDGGPVLLPRGQFTPLFRHVFADDVAKAIALCLGNDHAFGRAYNIAGEEILTLFDYIQLLSAVLGCGVQTVEASYELIREQPGLKEYRAEYDDRRVLDISRIKAEMGFVPTPICRWLEATIRWYGENPQPDSAGYARRTEEIAAAKTLGKL